MRMATTLSVLVLGVGAIGHALVTGLDSGIGRIDPFKDMKNRPEAGNGTNLLLVGTDGRDRITREDRHKYRLGGAPCRCTDTIMLVHISADRERASVVSLPRDSYAEIPPHTDATTGVRHAAHPVKLNAAYAEGGPALTVRTVEHMTKVKIDHYLEVDFTSFMKTVDAVGGVRICTAKPMKDNYTGLDLAAGTHQLDGGRALQYVRSRHVDGAADLGRMQRQQRFVAALIQQATSSGALLNPVKFREVSRAVLNSVRADRGFGADQLLSLGKAMRDFSPSSSEFTSVPVGDVSHPVPGIGSTVKWDPAKSTRLFAALREDRPLMPDAPRKGKGTTSDAKVVVDVPPRGIRVQVYNATAIDGLGARVDAGLRASGFATTRAPRNGERRDLRRTVVTYDPRWDRSAKSLAAALPGSELRPVRGQGPTLRVLAGTDFTKVTPVRAETPPKGKGVFDAVTGDEVVCP
ncbi:LCP family protein [Streptomyces sp. FIT100]|uniref:LCP family protein n=1 Tax=Streptomyces sp. FIT100 TaxID=2837956 RepID=UPI0021C62984|nr:LCP family protein [Streptomyces sp. FIT100]UUN27240.1 LCP family protein [Streptomyces sp. FIT100]